jgi:two-component system phosphate regulon sensor histidine kinase PhoR
MNPTLMQELMVREDPAGKKPIEVLRNVEIQEIADNVLEMKEAVETREISMLLPDEKILMVHATPMIREGSVDGAVFVFHDMTELRRLENIRKDFVANVSHELRTPVANIKGYAETLLDGAMKDERHAEEFIRIIQADSDRLAQLVEDLLDLSKIESGKLTLKLAPRSVGNTAARVMRQLGKQAEAKKINMKEDIRQGLPDVMADETLISQVLFNLIDNAIKYTPDGGRIEVRARDAGDFVRVDVEDTGVGIMEKDLPRIFERFYRVDKARSRQMGGTGLGLSIVKHIVQEHGGEVSVQSVPGKGSVFSFTIPKA